MLVAQYSLAMLEPAFDREKAVVRNVRLPYGGPTGSGGSFPKGTVLGCVSGTVQSEVATLTIDGTAAHVTTFTADKVYSVSHAYDATLAAVQTAWEAVFGAGNVLVGGTPGTSYTLTFRNQLANVRIGGLFAVSATGGTPSWARTTRGSAGPGQFDKYVDAGTNSCPATARAVLAHDYASDPTGGLVTEGLKTMQGYSPLAFLAGFFNLADLTGMDANGAADSGWRFVEGNAVTETGVVLGLGV